MKVLRLLLVFGPLALMYGCASTPPSSLDNVCHIFDERRSWYKAAKKAEERWGTPIPISMAFIHQESRFVAKARPPRRKFLWVIPGPRPSSAYGYSQAKKSTWKWYQSATGNGWAGRSNFADAVDFIGWYNAETQRRNKVAAQDAYNLYLAYHEGHGGFERRSFQSKDWLKSVATKVSARSQNYAQQLESCRRDLDRRRWLFF